MLCGQEENWIEFTETRQLKQVQVPLHLQLVEYLHINIHPPSAYTAVCVSVCVCVGGGLHPVYRPYICVFVPIYIILT